MNEIIISCSTQIESELKKIHIGKIGRNKTEDEELYLVLCFLQDDISDIHLAYPFSIFIRDKPDILLRDKHREIGIEVTFAINESYQKAKMLRDENNKSLILEPSLYKNNKNRKYIEETIEKSNKRLYGGAYIDSELEEEVSELVLSLIKRKIKKFEEYDKFKENFLLIFSDALFADEDILSTLIQKELVTMLNIPFDKIILRYNRKNIFLV